MIHFGIILPLAIGGVVGAVWREYKKAHRKQLGTPRLLTSSKAKPIKIGALLENSKKEFDDVGELNHYQRVSWYTLALSASGSLFYTPVVLLSVPLLSYNAYHFIKTMRHSEATEQKSPMAIFEMVAIAGTLVTGRLVTASMLMIISFGMRNLLLQAGNISNNVGFVDARNPKYSKVWILRDGAELEALVADLQNDDIIVLHPNDTIVVNGEVVDVAGAVRQYSLLKKMKSVSKQKGDQVYPFTRLESGHLYVQVG